jgi:AcrR family transcriptional regulator
LRERKKVDTRRRLMASALQLFAERGFEETTVEEIAAAADVAPRTFFRYFPNKVDVLFGDHEELVTLLRDTLASRSPGEPVVRAVRRASLQALEGVVADPDLFLTRSRLVLSIPAAHARSRLLDADYEDVIAEAVAAERNTEAATDVAARIIARAAINATRAARDVWVSTHGARDPNDLVNEAFDVLEHGIR